MTSNEPIRIGSLSNDYHMQLKRTAQHLYDQSHRHHWLSHAWQMLRGRVEPLRSLDEVEAAGLISCGETSTEPQVLLSQICGSRDRAEDFDQSFRPLRPHTQARWLSVAFARLAGKRLPAVNLIRVGEAYYVIDGHHRISVARALGDETIEAIVTVWQIETA